MRSNLCIITALLAFAAVANSQRILCYYDSSTSLRGGNGNFGISNINVNLCSHLIYAYIGVNADGTVQSLRPQIDLPASESGGRDGNLIQFNNLKNQNGRLRTLVAFGGPEVSSATFSQMANSFSTRSAFVNNVVAFVKKYGFNGISVDWQYPNQNGGNPADRNNFIFLLFALRQRFDQEALTLAISVAGDEPSARLSYDNIPEVTRYVDFVNIRAFDIYTPANSYTGHTSPYYRRESDTGDEALRNVNASLNFWINGGANPANINLGIAFYGHSYNLNNPNQAGVGAPATIGAGGPYTQKPGVISYLEVCEDQKANPALWRITYEQTRVATYAVKGNVGSATYWVSYETPSTVASKTAIAKPRIGGVAVYTLADDDFRGNCGTAYPLLRSIRDELSLEQKIKLLKDYNLGGAMTWSIESDDFRGICGDKYPLLNAIKYALNTA